MGSVTPIYCPADGCEAVGIVQDPDGMLGHLISDHEWEFERANEWFKEEWPDE